MLHSYNELYPMYRKWWYSCTIKVSRQRKHASKNSWTLIFVTLTMQTVFNLSCLGVLSEFFFCSVWRFGKMARQYYQSNRSRMFEPSDKIACRIWVHHLLNGLSPAVFSNFIRLDRLPHCIERCHRSSNRDTSHVVSKTIPCKKFR